MADGLAVLGDFSGRRRTPSEMREDVRNLADRGEAPGAVSSSGAGTDEGTGYDLESSTPEEGGVVAQVGRLGVAALAGLVVADVILVSLAVGHVRDASDAGASPPGADDQVTAGGPKKGEQKPEKKEPEPPVIDPAASRMLVDIGEGDAVGRAISGVCGEGGAEVQLSLDGGETFSGGRVPSAEVVLRLAVTNADEAWLVAAGKDCEEISTWRTENGGGSWDYDEASSEAWHKLAEPASAVHAPGGESEVPCGESAVVTLSTLGPFQAYVLCDNGLVASTSDGGEEWTEQGKLPGAADLDFVDPESGLAVVAGHESCEGIAVLQTADVGESWEPHGCIETDDISQLADISTTGDNAYVAAGESLWFSSDGGATWEQRGE